MKRFSTLVLAAMLGLPALAATPTATLPNGRTVRPTGQLHMIGNLPFTCAVSPEGRWVAVLHGGKTEHGIDLFDASASAVVQHIKLPDSFGGLAWASDGTLWASGASTHAVFSFTLEGERLSERPRRIAEGYVAGLTVASGSLVAVDNAGGRLCRLNSDGSSASVGVAPAPYAVAVTPKGDTVATSWGEPVLSVWRRDGRVDRVPVGSHPTAIAQDPRSGAVYVANANDDTVSVLDAGVTRVVRTLSLRAFPGSPLGSTPTALAVAPDGQRLYVALSGVNAVAVVDLRTARELGRIPTAWYPAGLAIAPDGRALYVACAKGLGAGPRKGDRPSWLMDGALQVVHAPDATSLAAMTRTVREANGYGDRPPGVGKLPPIKHVVYVVRENRSYDQEFGDLPGGDGDPALTIFGRDITPNTHALAERFAFGDRFFCDGEVSAQGHQWLMGGITTDTVERLWPPVYAGKGRWVDSDDPLVYPDSDYLIDRCVARAVSCRMYGDYLRKGPDGKVLPRLRGLRSPTFKGWDLGYSDLDRLSAWEAEFRAGVFPAFSHVWLPNDHTAGTRPGSLTPRAMVAQNDVATGKLVEILSHDPRWRDTLVIIQEDDAQAGYDHVDGHRSVLVLASPWIRSGAVTSRHYSTSSMVATVTALLGLGSLSQFDARSPVVDDVWSATPDLRPFTALDPRVALGEVNPPTAPLARESKRFDFSQPDAGDQHRLAAILWRAAHSHP